METVHLSYPLNKEIIERFARPQILALGQFDGLHLGHASVIQAALQEGTLHNVPTSLMTFYPHPKEVMKKGDYDGYLTPAKEKEELLRSAGVDFLYVVEFNADFSRITPQQFVTEMLLPLQIHTAIVGFDFRFGHKGEGEAEMLKTLGKGSFETYTVPPFVINNEKVSSSGIRRYLQAGSITLANQWLGRPYTLSGTVIHGEKRGRTIGFPTANVELSEPFVLPKNGVYAVVVRHKGEELSGVMNIGVKPTFHSGVSKPWFEVHVFDFNGDLYGEELQVKLISYIREERKFQSIDELIAQISRDADTARNLLQSSES
ncbi:bifunctional riboflavin kinase/FAD synthetase [Paenibacillus sp. YPG26]|uniref:bifunctional riboflavin kinase/FAD synthetase n=1 Tax=Paenibacillus sp. YPG26 TaxID=2878915 RepID=UPI00203BFADA|nr:bifunctional riboflavin kinase/FAD synthetase [Paenibacillus sp. YPG26]USB32049.1 bifunctional riboflavin kinase/FAD synthetase [Paenibacillus sp. YPG26]